MTILIITWPNCIYLLVDPGFLSFPLNFYESQFVPPIGWTPLTDTTDKETNEQTDGRTEMRLFVRPSVRSIDRLLDGVYTMYSCIPVCLGFGHNQWRIQDFIKRENSLSSPGPSPSVPFLSSPSHPHLTSGGNSWKILLRINWPNFALLKQ